MFSKVLIANRGAIAMRIMRTLKKLNIASVAVYADADYDSLHVRRADEAYPLGEGGAADTYLNIDKLLDIAQRSGAQAIHPGYGFLSENPEFVRRCEAAGIAFVGPAPEQMEMFGLKHTARALAEQAQVPLLPGSGLLADIDEAKREAQRIGYPVMLKSTAGGGGIGMSLCHDEAELDAAFATVKRLGANNFANDGVFLEKYIAAARHIEVQIFGDGAGKTLALGERDCSSQRRHQKVVEECPAPNLPDSVRRELHATAERLLAQVNYRNAGTVEFIYDRDAERFYFLEVNTRLQVEHGVTEEVYGIDLVAWMLRQAAGDTLDPDAERAILKPTGHALQVRLYAEDPHRSFQPCAGLLSRVKFPQGSGLRIDHWIESGIDVPPFFDPMLAKLIVHRDSRDAALQAMREALRDSELYGIETNRGYLLALLNDPVLTAGEVTTRYLNGFQPQPARIDVLQGGTQTTIQDWPGRGGYWHVGVPPSGPFDSYSFRLGNTLLGNPEGMAGLEITLQGPQLRFTVATRIVIAGAAIEARLEGEDVPLWQAVDVTAGDTLHLGRIRDAGVRAYLLVAGGLDCPEYLGSRSTFTLGQFGGHNGRALRTGDVLRFGGENGHSANSMQPYRAKAGLLPQITNTWQLRVIYGPHGAPDFFTGKDIKTFFDTDWEIHYNSSRTGIRLIGPKPQWARADGGEAGLHPSNIHDNAYAFGSVDFTGDMPVILGPDGPSLGGFVCPATVIQADLWKLGQLRAGDKIRFVAVDLDEAVNLEAEQKRMIAGLRTNHSPPPSKREETNSPRLPGEGPGKIDTPILARLDKKHYGDKIVFRAAGDHFLLVEYGPLELQIRLRFRAHALMQWLESNPLAGMRELTPGIRSLQIHYDSQILSHRDLLAHLKQGEAELAQHIREIRVPSRIVHLPLSWDDAACRLAIEKYMQSVRPGAPWCPSNLEFIRRINGLNSIEQVKDIVFSASYLVMGLGDVYLGAPVATPLDPRHRLVTTKYNPARTWTAENSVGIGGSYLCVYGMEGPGGYQFVGRTLQMWNRYRHTEEFEQPWLLRFFDQIRFYPVSAEELHQIRRDFPQGRYPLKIEQSEFSLVDYEKFLAENQASISGFCNARQAAFEEELQRWHADGQFNYEAPVYSVTEEANDWPEEHLSIDSPVSGSLWKSCVTVGDRVEEGEQLLILESMKMEITLSAPITGTISRLLVKEGDVVRAGQVLVLMESLV